MLCVSVPVCTSLLQANSTGVCLGVRHMLAVVLVAVKLRPTLEHADGDAYEVEFGCTCMMYFT